LLYERTGERRGAGDISEKIEGQKARVQKARVIPDSSVEGRDLNAASLEEEGKVCPKRMNSLV